IDDLLVTFRLEKISTRTRMKGFADELVAVVHGEYQDLGIRRALANVTRCLHPVEKRERDIEDRDIRLMLEHEVDRLPAVTCFGAHDEVRTRFEQRAQSAPDNQMIISQNDTEQRHSPTKPQPYRSPQDDNL